MNVEIEGRPEPLDAVHRTRASTDNAVRGRAVTVETGDGAHEDPAYGATQCRTSCEDETHHPGEGDDPLPDRNIRQDVVHEVRGGLRHASSPTGRTESSPFAREGHQDIGVTVEAGEAVGQDSAAQVGAQLAHDVGRQAPRPSVVGARGWRL